MTRFQVVFNDVGFGFPDSPRTLFSDLSLHLSAGWTGIIGANGAGKSTLLSLATGDLSPDRGSIVRQGLALICAQRTDRPPEMLASFLSAPDNYLWLDALGVGYDWDTRWSTLSHGERKRAQLAVALWREPDILAIDEPTNHLDGEARDRIAAALARFRGAGLLVSHDRALLDRLCSECLFLEGGSAQTVPGTFSEAEEVRRRDEEAGARAHDRVKRERKRLAREVARANQAIAASSARLSKRGIAHKDHDAKSKIDGARLTGKDTGPARLKQRLESRMRRESAAADRFRPGRKATLGIALTGTPATKKQLMAVPAMTLPLGEHRRLIVPPLVIGNRDRIGITGPNGAGKSTLLARLTAMWPMPTDRLLFLPQEVTAERASALHAMIQRQPGARKGQLMQLVSRLGSDPKRLLDSRLPSPGETRKLMLALGLLEEPHLIAMDEPTNHLDLPSVACLEEALAEIGCALILVSHDLRFLAATTSRRWVIDRAGEDRFEMTEGVC